MVLAGNTCPGCNLAVAKGDDFGITYETKTKRKKERWHFHCVWRVGSRRKAKALLAAWRAQNAARENDKILKRTKRILKRQAEEGQVSRNPIL